MLATHDQILAGATKQSYAGCRFPACSEYAGDIAHQAVKVGRSLARSGVVGHVGIDFVVRPAVRVGNLCGRDQHSHDRDPASCLHAPAADGRPLRPSRGPLPNARRDAPVLRRPDKVAAPRGIGLEQLLDRARRGGVAWDPVRQTGVVFQTVSGLAVSGEVGVTAISSRPEEAEALLERTVRLLAGLSAA